MLNGLARRDQRRFAGSGSALDAYLHALYKWPCLLHFTNEIQALLQTVFTTFLVSVPHLTVRKVYCSVNSLYKDGILWQFYCSGSTLCCCSGGAGSRGARGQMGGRGAARGAGRGGGPAPRGRGASASASMGMSAAQSYGAESYNYVRSTYSLCTCTTKRIITVS